MKFSSTCSSIFLLTASLLSGISSARKEVGQGFGGELQQIFFSYMSFWNQTNTSFRYLLEMKRKSRDFREILHTQERNSIADCKKVNFYFVLFW